MLAGTTIGIVNYDFPSWAMTLSTSPVQEQDGRRTVSGSGSVPRVRQRPR